MLFSPLPLDKLCVGLVLVYSRFFYFDFNFFPCVQFLAVLAANWHRDVSSELDLSGAGQVD
jgi:hypothetical protein